MDAEPGTATPILQNSECINMTQVRATSAPNRRMPGRDHRAAVRLTNSELETTARACRALAYQEEQSAKRMENPGMHGPIAQWLQSLYWRALSTTRLGGSPNPQFPCPSLTCVTASRTRPEYKCQILRGYHMRSRQVPYTSSRAGLL
jgi:hypothetical protein